MNHLQPTQSEVFIKDLRVRAHIGITETERASLQNLSIHIVLGVEVSDSFKSDRIEDTVDYFPLHQEIVSLVEQSSFHLIESLAYAIAQLCLAHTKVKSARVRVEKPHIVEGAESAGFMLTLQKS